MPSELEKKCAAQKLKMTGQRKIIMRALEASPDHPDVEQLHGRVQKLAPKISLATVYRTVRLLEERNIINRREFGDGRARYEGKGKRHHDHLIDVKSGKIIEFTSPEIELFQEKIAKRLGYRIIGHRLELYGEPLRIKSK